jgi:myo-inositol 2-dehydrogenase / D-chiro-inositol 1-dehydrogenase
MRAQASDISRRQFLGTAAAGVASVTIVPRNVLGRGETPPSEEFGGALIGCGGRGEAPLTRWAKASACSPMRRAFCRPGRQQDDLYRLSARAGTQRHRRGGHRHPARLARPDIRRRDGGGQGCDVREADDSLHLRRPGGRRGGKAVRADLPDLYVRTLRREPRLRKIFESGLLNKCDTVRILRGGVKVQQWSGRVVFDVRRYRTIWTGRCTAVRRRCAPTTRIASEARIAATGITKEAGWPIWPTTIWTGPAYEYGRDLTAPVEVIPHAPVAHPEACGMWGWCELKYADGFTLVLDSGEWGPAYDRLQEKNTSERDLLNMLSEQDRKKLDELPDPEPLVSFPEAIRTRKRAGGNAEVTQRVATIYHLANVAFRCNRPLRFDPVTERIVGDEEADRLVNQPMRAPWVL